MLMQDHELTQPCLSHCTPEVQWISLPLHKLTVKLYNRKPWIASNLSAESAVWLPNWNAEQPSWTGKVWIYVLVLWLHIRLKANVWRHITVTLGGVWRSLPGLSYIQVATNLNVDPSTVYRTVKLFDETGFPCKYHQKVQHSQSIGYHWNGFRWPSVYLH